MLEKQETFDLASTTVAEYIRACGCNSREAIACVLAALISTAGKVSLEANGSEISAQILRAVAEVVEKPGAVNNTGIELIYSQTH